MSSEFEEQLRHLKKLHEGDPDAVELAKRIKEASATEQRKDYFQRRLETYQRQLSFLEETIRPMFEAINAHYLAGRGKLSTFPPPTESLPDSTAVMILAWDEKEPPDEPGVIAETTGQRLIAFFDLGENNLEILPGKESPWQVWVKGEERSEWEPKVKEALIEMISSGKTKWYRLPPGDERWLPGGF